MAKALVYGSMDPCSILAPFIDFLFFFLILWKFSKLEAGFGYITPLNLDGTFTVRTPELLEAFFPFWPVVRLLEIKIVGGLYVQISEGHPDAATMS